MRPSLRTIMRRAARVRRGLRGTLDRVPLLLDAPAGELRTMPAIALLANDWPTALQAAGTRLLRDPADEGALVARAVALWELGREAEAAGGLAERDARAAVRFAVHTDDPATAQVALDRLAAPSAALALGVARLWHRHGDHDRAEAGARAALARWPGDAAAVALLRTCEGERRVLEGRWATPADPQRFDPVPGRVLHVLQWSLPHRRSGSTYRSFYTVRAQAAAGLEPHVLTQPGNGWPAGAPLDGLTELFAGVAHHRVARTVAVSAPVDERLDAFLRAAAPVVERVRPAVLHAASDYVNALVALELGRRYGLPVVYEVRGFPEVLQGRWAGSRAEYEKSVWRRRIEARCWREADEVVTLSEGMRGHILRHGAEPGRVTVVSNAVDAERFRPVAPDPALRERLGLPADGMVAGYVSSLVPYEGVPTLIEAVARLTERGVAVCGLVVGEGSELPHLRQLARRLGVADRVILPGAVPHDEVLRLYALLDVFVVPRRTEPTTELVTPLKPYEAMATGRAVVVSGTPALREMVVEGETGLAFVPDDVESLCEVLAALSRDPARRAALGRQARAWVGEHRTWAGNAEIYRTLYDRLT